MSVIHGCVMWIVFIPKENVLSFIHTSTMHTQNIWAEIGQQVTVLSLGSGISEFVLGLLVWLA